MNHSSVKILIISKIGKETRIRNYPSRKFDVQVYLGAFIRLPFPLFCHSFPNVKKELHSSRGALRQVENLSINPIFHIKFKSLLSVKNLKSHLSEAPL